MSIYLITGSAGFIGFAMARRLLADGHTVYGVDNYSDYYDVTLKQKRTALLQKEGGKNYIFQTLDLANEDDTRAFFTQAEPEYVVHLAAQASVRYGLKNPMAYCKNNLVGHFHVLEACRNLYEAGTLKHLVYASSSSVYGGNEKVPFSETDDVSRPVSLYAATKRADELITYSYSHMWQLPATCVRFFTVYGPWGRPDMSPMIFGKAILAGTPLPVFNHGDLWRDFTYVDDIVEGVVQLTTVIPQGKIAGEPPHCIYNIGNSEPVKLLTFIETLGDILGKKPVLDLQDCPPTEVYKTYADTSALEAKIGWKPHTNLRDGLQKFADWFAPYEQGKL